MSRPFSSNTLAAFDLPFVSVLTFVKLEFQAATVYVHNGIGTYTWGGFDWLGVGNLGSVSKLEEGSDVSPYSITLTLSALDATLAGTALLEDYFMRPVSIYIGVLSADDELLDTPLEMWAGFMDVMTISAGQEGGDGDQIFVTCESELAEFDRSANLRYTNQSQQRQYPLDTFFEFMAKISGLKVKWRGDSDSAGTDTSTGGIVGGEGMGSGGF
jgi:hypothetical protein|tara:strand:- start:93 stop:734 length:642 start_codon:yes stop_codon:yes gene_type:complete